MKICEIRAKQEKAAGRIMEQLKPATKLVRPTYRIPEWSSRAEEEFICKDVGCSPARKENGDDLCGGRAMRRDRRGEDVPGGLRHDRSSGWGSAYAEAALRDGYIRVGKSARLAETRESHACGDRLRFTLHLPLTVRYLLDLQKPFR